MDNFEQASIKPSFINTLKRNIRYWERQVAGIEQRKYGVLAADFSNLIRCVRFGLTFDATRIETAQLVSNSFTFIETFSYENYWVPFLNKLVDELYRADLPLSLYLNLLSQWGYFVTRPFQPTPDQFLSRTEKGIAQLNQQIDPNIVGRLFLNTALYYQKKQALELALEALRSGTDIVDHNSSMSAAIYNSWGQILIEKGELDNAEEKFNRAIKTWEHLGRHNDLVRSTNNLAQVAIYKKDNHLADIRLRRVLSLLDESDNIVERTHVMLNLGVLNYNQNKLEETLLIFKQVDTNALDNLGRFDLLALTFHGLGETNFYLDNIEEANYWLVKAITMAKLTDIQLYLGNSLGMLAKVKHKSGEINEAQSLLTQGVQVLAELSQNHIAISLKEEFEELPWFNHNVF